MTTVNVICVSCGMRLSEPSLDFLCPKCRVIAGNAVGGVRRGDPFCSRKGALAVFGRSGNQRRRLFVVFVDSVLPLTDYDAAKAAGMLGEGTCYWKRCGELRERGVIAFTGRSQLTAGSDVPRELSEVTALGMRLWLHVLRPV